MNYLLSVVVPVYNVEKYLDRCVYSLINQTYKNLEIILVDDESPDNSPFLCDEWKNKDKRIKVIHKKNSGLGLTRNAGMDIANGDYITFVDSDDYLEINALEECIKVIKQESLDICRFGLIEKFASKEISYQPPEKQLYIDQDNVEFAKDILGKRENDTTRLFSGVSACTSVYSLQFLRKHNIRFTSERETLCEDIIFNFEASLYAKKTYIIRENYYYYCHHGDSLTTSYRPDRFKITISLYNYFSVKFSNVFKDDDFKNRLIRLILQNIIVSTKQEVEHINKVGLFQSYKNIKQITKNEELHKMLYEYQISKMPNKQKILFYSMKYRLSIIVYLITYIKCAGEKNEIK